MERKRTFSVVYYALYQRRFENAFEKNDLEKAISVLERLPPAHSEDERKKRDIIEREGYEAIARKLLDEKRGYVAHMSREICVRIEKRLKPLDYSGKTRARRAE